MQSRNVVLVDGVRSAISRGGRGKLVATRLDDAGAQVLRALLDRHPKVTDAMIEDGGLLPLGSDRERGGHKGYGLALMVDVLCCVLSGANWGPYAPPFAIRQYVPKKQIGKGIGHFFGAMRIAAFIDPDEFKRQIDAYRRVLLATKPAPGTDGPLVPGDPEREAEAIRAKEGIPLVMPVVEELRDISKQTGIPFD